MLWLSVSAKLFRRSERGTIIYIFYWSRAKIVRAKLWSADARILAKRHTIIFLIKVMTVIRFIKIATSPERAIIVIFQNYFLEIIRLSSEKIFLMFSTFLLKILLRSLINVVNTATWEQKISCFFSCMHQNLENKFLEEKRKTSRVVILRWC